MSHFEKEQCPLCCEDLEDSDLSFEPCPCGYQVCMFCWKRIKEIGNSKCPGCRHTYSEEGRWRTSAEK